MGAIMEISRVEYSSPARMDAGPSRISDEPSNTLQQKLTSIDQDIHEIDERIKQLKSTRKELASEREQLEREQLQYRQQRILPSNVTRDGKGKGKLVDYTGEFEFTQDLRERMKQVFNIDSFRLCQQGCVQ